MAGARNRTDWITSRTVALVKERASYSADAPFHPSESYPEHPHATLGSPNPAFRAVREALRSLRFDETRFGTSEWDPLSELIEPGQTVVLKPNLVAHQNLGKHAFGLTDTNSLVTHGSVVRAVIDYAAKALRGHGRIIIGDSPIQGTDWSKVVTLCHLDAIADHCRRLNPGITVDLSDYRLGRASKIGGIVVRRTSSEATRSQYEEVDLGDRSLLIPLMNGMAEFGVSQYPRWRMRAAHTRTVNKYLLPKEVLDADVVINLPKMKAHQKAAITGALKNLVGINGHKDFLPHFRFGSPKDGGDEYPDGGLLWNLMWWLWHKDWERDGGARKVAYGLAARGTREVARVLGGPRHASWLGGGSWHGNDTLWRTVLDINRAFFYFDRSTRRVADSPAPIRYLAIMDGLIGGQKESPLAPTPIASGCVLAGMNPLAVDAVASAMMGFRQDRVKTTEEGFRLTDLPLARFGSEDVEIVGPLRAKSIRDVTAYSLHTPFEPSQGFKGRLEIAP